MIYVSLIQRPWVLLSLALLRRAGGALSTPLAY